jgi:hypothetical protein
MNDLRNAGVSPAFWRIVEIRKIAGETRYNTPSSFGFAVSIF